MLSLSRELEQLRQTRDRENQEGTHLIAMLQSDTDLCHSQRSVPPAPPPPQGPVLLASSPDTETDKLRGTADGHAPPGLRCGGSLTFCPVTKCDTDVVCPIVPAVCGPVSGLMPTCRGLLSRGRERVWGYPGVPSRPLSAGLRAMSEPLVARHPTCRWASPRPLHLCCARQLVSTWVSSGDPAPPSVPHCPRGAGAVEPMGTLVWCLPAAASWLPADSVALSD